MPAIPVMHAIRRSSTSLYALLGVTLVVTMLYVAREFFIPLALAALLTFVLNPVVCFLHRRGLPRVLAVSIVTILCFSVLGLLGWLIAVEFRALVDDLPRFRDNIRARVAGWREASQGGFLERLSEWRRELDVNGEGSEEPVPVVVRDPGDPVGGGGPAGEWLDTVGSIVGTASVTIVFVIFMLLRQNEIRNRIMALAGYRRLTTTTRVIDEAGSRLSRYLLAQVTINSIHGTLLAIGLYLIGMPYVLLFGVLAVLFRFIPYVGPLVVSVLPAALSLAEFPGWSQPMMVIGLIVVLELFTNLVMEPVLYGRSAGVSDISLLVAITFWTWLWGGVGLILATPLTVCLVVLCKYVPRLEWVDLIMGDNPEMKPYMIYFQRLVAQDDVEAAAFFAELQRDRDPVAAADEAILPAIALARREFSRGSLSAAELEYIYEAVGREIEGGDGQTKDEPDGGAGDAPEDVQPVVIGRALQDGADDIALRILDREMPPGIPFDCVFSQRLPSEFLEVVEDRQPKAVLFSATPPDSREMLRINVKRFRAKHPGIRIFVGVWGGSPPRGEIAALRDAGVEAVFTRIGDALQAMRSLVPG